MPFPGHQPASTLLAPAIYTHIRSLRAPKGHYAHAWPRVNAGNWKDGPDSRSVCVVEISQIPAQYAFGMIYHLLDELMASCSRILSLSSCLLELMSARQPSPVKAWEGAVSKDRIGNPSNNEFQLQGEFFSLAVSHTRLLSWASCPHQAEDSRSAAFPARGHLRATCIQRLIVSLQTANPLSSKLNPSF